MTRTTAKPKPSKKSAADRDAELEAWMLGVPPLSLRELALLSAYRDAETAAKLAVPSLPPVAEESAAVDGEESAVPEPSAVPAERASAPGVPRLHVVEGLTEEDLPGLHGRLLAVGCLTCDLLGRADGLAYRLTREGRQRLQGDDSADLADAA